MFSRSDVFRAFGPYSLARLLDVDGVAMLEFSSISLEALDRWR